jgi:hypothetical protein
MLPRVEKPCSKEWDSLTGDDRKRFCEQCGLHVHNLSAMSRSEVSDFMSIPGRKCGAYTNDTRVPKVRASIWRFFDRLRMLRPAFAVVAVMISLLSAGCSTMRHTLGGIGPSPDGKSKKATESRQMVGTPPVEEKPASESKKAVIVGDIEERPLWKRILWPFGD